MQNRTSLSLPGYEVSYGCRTVPPCLCLGMRLATDAEPYLPVLCLGMRLATDAEPYLSVLRLETFIRNSSICVFTHPTSEGQERERRREGGRRGGEREEGRRGGEREGGRRGGEREEGRRWIRELNV